MIAKRIQRGREKQAKNDKSLFAYVGNEKNKGRGDPVTWELAEYATDSKHAGEKVESIRITNCVSDEFGWAVKEILATQAQNIRSNTDKSYHLVISFPEGERPTPEQLRDIEDEAVRAIGLHEHQRISAVHINTENYHLHVAINKVHPKTFRNVEPWYDKYRLQDACLALEKKHNLTHDNHANAPEHIAAKVAEMEAHAGKESFATWARETAAEAIVEAAKEGQSWADMHEALAQFDIEIRPRGAGLVISHRKDSRWSVKASDVAKEVAFKALTDRWGPYVPPAITRDGAQSSDRPTATDPMMGTDLSDAASRPGVQEDAGGRTTLGQEGADEPSSSVTPPAPPSVPRNPRYDLPLPIHQGPAVASLWDRYQAERQQAERDRDAALLALKAAHLAHAAEVTAYYADRTKATKAAKLSKANRLDSYRHIAADRLGAYNERVARERQERQTARAENPLISWQGFLEREAAAGDVEALATLRSRARKRYAILSQIIAAPDHVQAVHVIHANMKPFVGRNGDVFYSVKDGGSVIDSARHIAVPNLTSGAIILAVELAIQKYDEGELIVRGSLDFQNRVKEAAVRAGLRIGDRKMVVTDIASGHTVLVKTNDGAAREPSDHRGVHH